ncbi:WXG100 family type VII secretion target [Streptomyces flaveolus]|uniref:WXG100 family type VII secretion target n=1 Tax=Streptomyces flaveolus TaxID=67297 RepID=UPI003824CA75
MTDKQHEQDLERVSGQNTFTDLTRHAEQNPSGGFLFGAIDNMVRTAAKGTAYERGVQGRTNFDNHRLNDMIELVEQTNPEDLESSGKALWDARDAITEAAKELDGHIENVHWVGESGEAFRKWGRSLVTSTYGLSDFAGGAGDQITAAAVGLAAVRKAMPPRDTRPPGQDVKPEKLPTPKQVEGNPEYAEAVRVEKDRQEAINQMNRLSSYYAVASVQLSELPQPEFKTMPDVGVPQPERDSRYRQPEGADSSAKQGVTSGNTISRHSATDVGHPAQPQGESGTVVVPDGGPREVLDPTVSVGTTIDNAIAPTVPTAPSHGQTLPTSLPPTEGSGPTGPFSTGQTAPFSPARQVGPSNGRTNGFRSPLTAQGRTTPAAPAGPVARGVTGPGRQVGQGPLNQMGRTTPAGQSTAAGTTSGAKPISTSQGVSGGTPRATSPTQPKAGGGPVTGAGRGNGVVGGRPGSVPGGAGRGGARIPRGTVVGAEGTFGSVKGRPGLRGGANGSVDAYAKSPVTGAPAGRSSVARAERNGMTRGGAGLVREPGKQGNRRDERREEETQRPDYLVEDEETHLPQNPRRDVPPVVN